MRIVAVGAGAARRVVFMCDMHESNIENIHDMLVVERVEYIFALPAAFYEVVILEQLDFPAIGVQGDAFPLSSRNAYWNCQRPALSR